MKICIIGAFGFADLGATTGGQPVKTRNLYYALAKKYGQENISTVETYGWSHNPLKMIFSLLKEAHKSDVIIMLPAQNGLRIFSRLLLLCRKKHSCLYYDVIGGWLADKCKKSRGLIRCLNKFNSIWVETTSMKQDLLQLGLNNVVVVPNFKVYDDENSVYGRCQESNHNETIKVCTFSRVMKEKGIEDAIQAVEYVYEKRKDIVLDIYGPVDDSYKETFECIVKNLPAYIKYNGVISPDKCVGVLQDYDALLFPTHFYTEGIPGTIIDAYTAGVPIITALWLNSGDLFKENETGWGYEFDDSEGLKGALLKLAENRTEFCKMRKGAKKMAQMFSPEVVTNQIVETIEKDILNGN